MPTSNDRMGSVEDALAAPKMNQRITLSDGRDVSFSEAGPADGFPVLFFGGMAGHRFMALGMEDLGARHSLRIICVDRPNRGRTFRVPCRKLQVLEWPDVSAALAEALGLREFALVGTSCGAVFALATALRLPHLVAGPVILLGAWVPLDGPGTNANYKRLRTVSHPLFFPYAHTMRLLVQLIIRRKQPSAWTRRAVRRLWRLSPAEEAAVFDDGGRMWALVRAVVAARHREEGPTGMVSDITFCVERHNGFGFDFAEVQRPVHFFHGAHDNMVPLPAVEAVVARMPAATLTVRPEGSHHLPYDHECCDMALGTLAASLRARPTV